MGAGAYQADALQNFTGSINNLMQYGSTASGVFAQSGGNNSNSVTGSGSQSSFSFDPSRVARTSTETRGAATRVAPVVLV